MNGFLNVYKPAGMSSAAVVGKIKRMTGEKKVGHAGTLDPEASGVLPVMLGRATRLFDFLVDKVKVYDAVCEFGKSTDTQDATGTVTAIGSSYPSLVQVVDAKKQLEGDIWQRPSQFSAIKQGGKPLYQRARDGEDVQVPLRQVHVDEIAVIGEEENHGVRIRVQCGKGTYIRSICNDLGEITGCPAHMRSLCRVQSGFFRLENAVTLQQIQQFSEQNTIEMHLVPLDAPLGRLPRLDADISIKKLVENGSKIDVCLCSEAENLPEDVPTRMYMNGTFWGICRREGSIIRWLAQIPPEKQ